MPKRKASQSAKPTLADQIFSLMVRAGDYAPGFRELDGTTYRVLDFNQDDIVIPKHLKDRFVGAIAEWANDKAEPTALTLYQDIERFGADFARIDIVADQI